MKRSAPRTKLRGVIKKNNPAYRCGKNTELLIFLDCVLMLKALARQANHKALENRERTITASHIQQVEKEVLKSFKG
ncbi:centromere protein W-like [Apostichopus japonicus]|uniref:centromere protein W-like n=1 Tax=Stichopus japonicus TaxID=307972 RepID=UPI003AB89AD5